MSKFKMFVTYENRAGEQKTVEPEFDFRTGETVQDVVLDVVRNGLRFPTVLPDGKKIWVHVLPHRIIDMSYED